MNKKLFKGMSVVIAVVFVISPSAWPMSKTPSYETKKLPYKAPKFPKRAIWLNAPEDKHFKDLKGRVTLLDFFDYASVNSVRNLHYVKKWNHLYHPLGLQVIGVHAPDFSFEYKKENVKNALERLGIDFPVLMDNSFKTWKEYDVFLWPTQFIIDHNGNVVYEQAGEGNYREFEEQLRRYLSEANPKTRFPAFATGRDEQDLFDQLFCGTFSETVRTGTGGKEHRLRGPSILNKEGFVHGHTVKYEDRGVRDSKGFFAHGPWRNREDYFEHARTTEQLEDYLGVSFEGYEAYAVLGSSRLDPVRFYLLMDSQPIMPLQRGQDVSTDEYGKTYVMVDEPRLYYLVRNVDAGQHELKLYTNDDGASVYAFSFGNRCLTQFEKL